MDAGGLEKHVLATLASGKTVEDTWKEAESLGIKHQELVGVVQSLWTDEYVTMEVKSRSWLVPTAEGETVRRQGSPEVLAWQLVFSRRPEPTSIKELETELGKDAAKVGLGAAMKAKWLKKEGAGLIPTVDSVEDVTKKTLDEMALNGTASPESEKALSRRKLCQKQTLKYYQVKKGPKFAKERRKRIGDVTFEALRDGSWETSEFKPYNFATLGAQPQSGYVQPLLKVRAEFRRILMGMGFEEMATNRWVESSFWNFDALFQPQSHPARDAHDTFFVKDPHHCQSWPEDYYQKVKSMHETGGAGSIGHRCHFDPLEAKKNLLRTHTTAVSARMLHALAQQKPFKPTKLFSIDRVFRNETMDSTHLCEFHQVEGLVADYDLSLGNLVAVIREFFKKIGITQLRFKPAFNPYTEPSMEVFGYHPDLQRWTEIGNSGMFRPEMLAPMGFPPNVRVIAWGLSLERPTMIKYRISNIRDLFGHKADLNRTKQAPMCLF